SKASRRVSAGRTSRPSPAGSESPRRSSSRGMSRRSCAPVDCRATPRRGDMAVALLTLALAGTVALAVTTALGYLVPADATRMREHFLLALGSTTLLVMAHSSIMFFLIATGV